MAGPSNTSAITCAKNIALFSLLHSVSDSGPVQSVDDKIIDLTGSSPPTSPPPAGRNVLPPRRLVPVTEETQAHQTPSSMQAIRFAPLNRFRNLSQNASEARVGAFGKKEHEDRSHAGWSTHRSCQQEKKKEKIQCSIFNWTITGLCI